MWVAEMYRSLGDRARKRGTPQRPKAISAKGPRAALLLDMDGSKPGTIPEGAADWSEAQVW